MIRRSGAILIHVLLLAQVRPCWPDALPPLQLLSLVNLPVGSGQYMSSFHVDTWTVQLVAVCRIPIGWDVGGGTDGSPDGTLHGDAGVGAAVLPGPDPRTFKDALRPAASCPPASDQGP